MKNRTIKRTLALLLAVVLTLAMCPVAPTAAAATMSTDVCPCGCGKAWSSISWTSSGYLNRDLSKAGHYKMTKAFTASKEFEVTGKVIVDFNGYKLQAASGKRGFVVKSGGVLTILNRGGDNGRLVGENTTADGGSIYVEEGGVLNIISGRVVGKETSYKGGAIYNAGTVNITGTGTVENGKTSGTGGGNIYNAAGATVNFYGGTITGGSTTGGGMGGNVFNAGTMNIYGGTITGGEANGDNGYGGNIYNSGTLVMEDGTVALGSAQDHGGNLFVGGGSKFHIYGGTITGGTATGYGSSFSGYGGNIYTTGADTDFKIYGGTITAGQNTVTASYGGNIFANGGVQIYMYGGTISYGVAKYGHNIRIGGEGTVNGATQYSAFYLLGGEILASQSGDIYGATNSIIKMYNGIYVGEMDISGYVQECCCCVPNDTGYVMWNVGYEEGTCTDCLYDQAAAAGLVELSGGVHSFQSTGEHTYTCIGCGMVKVLENVQAAVNGELFEDMDSALAALEAGKKLTLMTDVTLDAVAPQGTLDLAGNTLTVTGAFTGLFCDVIDSSEQGTGKLVCDDVTLSETNTYLPVNYDGGIRFCPVGFTQWVEPTEADTTKMKFYFTQRAAQTLLDEIAQADSSAFQVRIHLSWTDAEGVAQSGTYSFKPELLAKYAEKWDGRVFVATVKGASSATALTCEYQVHSEQTGVVLAANPTTSAGYINEKLSWDTVNSYPLKTGDMTVEEMRQLCVDFMEYTKTYLWTPSESVAFIKNARGTKDSMSQGTVYGGLPYVGVASGNVYRMLDYIDPDTGILDMKKALPALGTKDQLAMSDLKYFGSQCSESVYWGWGRVMNSADYKWTASCVPKNGFILLGDIEIDETRTGWTAAYNTEMACENNGEQVMFGAYAECKKADGMVYYIEASDGDGAGHLVMVYSDAVVVYNEDGTINGDESYLTIIDQAQTWETKQSASGDTYKRKNSVNLKKTFTQLYGGSYVPFTFKEFLGEDPIEETTVSLTKAGVTLVEGTISEEDRTFQATTTVSNTLNWSDLFSCKVESNYGIVDAYIIVKDANGKELYKHAVRTATAGNKALTLSETGAAVTTWVTQNLTKGKYYTVEIEVQLATGERPVIHSGRMRYDKG